MPVYPKPMYALAIEPKSRADADKVSAALHKYTEEDPCFKADRDSATHELVIHGVGDMHLRTILAKSGFGTLRADGMEKVEGGLTTAEEVFYVTSM